MAQSINDFTAGSWDAKDISVVYDGMQVDIAGTGSKFTAAYDNNNVNISTDTDGNGVVIANHNHSATITVPTMYLSNLWKQVVEDSATPADAHTITITTPINVITTTSAFIQKLPDITGTNDTPTVDIIFNCINMKVTNA